MVEHIIINKPDSKSAKNSHVNKHYGTGRRKSAVARVWVRNGNGKFIINNKDASKYFPMEIQRKLIVKPFTTTNTLGQYDVVCTVKGSGKSGQIGAIIHGISRALDSVAPEFHQTLRKAGLLTRDSRVVERKKYGRHKARKSTQFSKR